MSRIPYGNALSKESAVLYALWGEMVFRRKIEQRSTSPDLFRLAPSMYILQMESQEGAVVSWNRLVIE